MRKGDSKTSAQRVSLSARAAKRRKKKKKANQRGRFQIEQQRGERDAEAALLFSLSLSFRDAVSLVHAPSASFHALW